MEKVARGLIVHCTDAADSHRLNVLDFTEIVDEIEITTSVYNEALQRCWIGDLSFQTCRTVDLVDCQDTTPVRDSHRDVLLASVRVWEANLENGVTWKYRFLKK